MVRQKIVVEEGYRTDDVEGAIVTSMGIVESDKGGFRAFMDFDDGKGMATYNLTVKGDIAGSQDEAGNYRIPGYLDFGKVNKSLQKLGYEPYFDVEAKEWGTEPSIVGQQAWIKCVKTSTGTDGKEYKSHIDVVKVGGDGEKPAPKAGAVKEKPKLPAVKGTLTPELLESWKDVLGKVLAEPTNEIAINTAVKKLFPDEATGKNAAHRKALADVRAKALAALVKDGTLELTEDGKYQVRA